MPVAGQGREGKFGRRSEAVLFEPGITEWAIIVARVSI